MIFLFYTFHSKRISRQKSIKDKRLKITFNSSNCDQKSQLSGILTEPLNPRDQGPKVRKRNHQIQLS